MVVRIGPGPDPGWLVVAVGAGLTVVGWYQISGQPTEAQQLPYLASATIPGAALIIAGTVMLAARHIANAAATATRAVDDPRGTVTYSGTGQRTPRGDDGLWALPEGNYVHRPDCPLIDGKPEAYELGREEAGQEEISRQNAADGTTARRPCPICNPSLPATPSSDSAGSGGADSAERG